MSAFMLQQPLLLCRFDLFYIQLWSILLSTLHILSSAIYKRRTMRSARPQCTRLTKFFIFSLSAPALLHIITQHRVLHILTQREVLHILTQNKVLHIFTQHRVLHILTQRKVCIVSFSIKFCIFSLRMRLCIFSLSIEFCILSLSVKFCIYFHLA